MSGFMYVLVFSLVGGLFSLLAGLLLLSRKGLASKLAEYSAPFAAGALLAAAFLELLPESIGRLAEGVATRWALVGLLTFFLLEHFLHWFHHHHEHADDKPVTPAPLIIVGDTIHNLLDGIAIGAAFLISVPAGIVTAIAVAAHEIPQEIGDFGLLLKYGYARKRVILINVLSALAATVGALVTYQIGSTNELPIGELLAITAGMFIYIAASDLIPTIHSTTKERAGYIAAGLLLLGVLTVGVATEAAHRYIPEEAHSHNVTEKHEEEHRDEAHDEDDHHDDECHDTIDPTAELCVPDNLLQ